MSVWYAYLLCCRDGMLYVGITTDVQRRFEQHCRGQGSRFVKSRGVDHLVACRLIGDGVVARRVEKRLKSMTRARKFSYFCPVPYVGDAPPLSETTEGAASATYLAGGRKHSNQRHPMVEGDQSGEIGPKI